jgi:peptidoglycan/LPS O-acetylase OafA/YrhL
MQSPKKLCNILVHQSNSFDLLRLICALLVIYGHSFAITLKGNPGGQVDIIETYIGCHSSSIAVYIFFFLSGLLVTNSLLNGRNSLHFIAARFFRIYPALIVLLLVTTFVIGPLISSKSFFDYLSNIAILKYFFGNLFLFSQYELPGLFNFNDYPDIVNGSLWTIKYEFFAYLVIVLMFKCKLMTRRIFSMITFFLVLLFCFSNNFLILKENPILYLALFFCIGVTLSLWRESISVNYNVPIIFFGLWSISDNALIRELLLYLTIFSSVLFIFSLNLINKLKIKIDISYGLYLYGFLVAQILALYFPYLNISYHQIITISVSLVLGYISAIYVENRMIKMGKKLILSF